MKSNLVKSWAIFALLILYCGIASAQDPESKKRKLVKITGSVSVVVAKATAKAVYESVKFAGKHVVVPAVKNVGVPIAKAAPGIAKAAAKLTAKGIKNGIDALSDNDNDVDNDTGQGRRKSN